MSIPCAPQRDTSLCLPRPLSTIPAMCGAHDEQPAVPGDEAWLRQYYTQAKADSTLPEALPALTPQPAQKYGESRPLGAGAEKDIVQVRDGDTLRDVALARPREGRSRLAFIREARLLARLEHPHIVPVHDLGLTPDGRPYFTMKLLAGETLEAVLGRLRQNDAATRAAYPLSVRLDIFVRVCEAVAFAHSRGIIHRDIKPANVQVGDYGDVRLMDWGLAKSMGDPADLPEHAGAIQGTPGYMSPEQAAGNGAADMRTDTYALGALLYALLSGYPPITGDSATEVLCKTIAGEIVPLRQRMPERNLPHALEAIVGKALATRPKDRYPTADALLADLQAFINGYATLAEQAGPLRLLWLVVQRHRALVLTIAASLLALAMVGVVAVLHIRASRDQTRVALRNLQEERAIRTRLTRPAVPKLLGEAHKQMRSLAYDDALETLRTVIGVDPAQREAWELAGWIYLGAEQYELAISAFRQDLQIVAAAGLGPRSAGAVTGADFATTQTVAAAVGRGGEAPGAVRKHVRSTATRKITGIADPGITLAERAWHLSQDGSRSLTPDEFRQLIEQARAAGARSVRDNSRTALGVYCSRNNPRAWTNAAYGVFVQWAVRALNDGHADLDLQLTVTGLEARVTGAIASDLLPLAGLPLTRLDVHGTAVRDLQPLRGMPLQALNISGTGLPLTSFEPIYGLPLHELDAEGFQKMPADLFVRCLLLETVTVSAGTELSRKDARWPAGVRVVRGK